MSNPSQYNPGNEIPEKSWVYWLLKKYAFHDYGAYSKHFDIKNWQPTIHPEGNAPAAPQNLVQLEADSTTRT